MGTHTEREVQILEDLVRVKRAQIEHCRARLERRGPDSGNWLEALHSELKEYEDFYADAKVRLEAEKGEV